MTTSADVASGSLESHSGSINEIESLPRLLCFGLQHVLVMYAGTVAGPLILGCGFSLRS